MKKALALLLLALAALADPARALPLSLPAWTDSENAAWWAKNPTPDLWPQAADALQAQLDSSYKQNGNRTFSDPDFQGLAGSARLDSPGLWRAQMISPMPLT